MKIIKIIGAFLPIVVICFILQNPYKVEVKANSQKNMSGNAGNYLLADANIDNVNNEAMSMTQYKNTTSHDVKLDVSNIKLICHGKGNNRDKDELLAEKNMIINATFSKGENDEQVKSLVIGSGETAFISISTEYTGDVYPENEVSCGYKIAVNLGQ